MRPTASSIHIRSSNSSEKQILPLFALSKSVTGVKNIAKNTGLYR